MALAICFFYKKSFLKTFFIKRKTFELPPFLTNEEFNLLFLFVFLTNFNAPCAMMISSVFFLKKNFFEGKINSIFQTFTKTFDI
jgi:hypothetical protein